MISLYVLSFSQVLTSYFLGGNPGISESFGSWSGLWFQNDHLPEETDSHAGVDETASECLRHSHHGSLHLTTGSDRPSPSGRSRSMRVSDDSRELVSACRGWHVTPKLVIQASSLLCASPTFVDYYYCFPWCGVLHNSFSRTYRRATPEEAWSSFNSHTTSF